MTRIAVCMSGHLRSWNFTFKSVRRLLFLNNHPNFDLFLSTWSDPGDNAKSPSIGHLKSKEEIISYPKEEIIHQRYSPWLKRFNIEDSPKFPSDIKSLNLNGINFNIASMYYKIKDCWRLMVEHEEENNFKYDLVIRTRPDLRWITFNTNYILSQIFNNKKCFFMPSMQKYNGYNDQFSIALRPIMEHYMNLFDNFKEYYETGNVVGHWAEGTMKYHMERINVSFSIMDGRHLEYSLMRIPRKLTKWTIQTYKNWDNHFLSGDPFWGHSLPSAIFSPSPDPIDPKQICFS